MIYVISDVHGLYDRYETAVNRLETDDFLYILGDAIDRGPDGVKILQDIQMRKNVELILGNHECFLIDYLMNRDSLLWTDERNGGEATLIEILELSEEEREELKDWLMERAVFQRLVVNQRKFHLSHGSFMAAYQNKEKMLFNEMESDDVESYVWTGIDDLIEFSRYVLPDIGPISDNAEETFVVGYVPVQCFRMGKMESSQINDKMVKWKNIVDIDGGCAMYKPGEVQKVPNHLILLCLDTMEEEYID